jgi:hypothetical protein
MERVKLRLLNFGFCAYASTHSCPTVNTSHRARRVSPVWLISAGQSAIPLEDVLVPPGCAIPSALPTPSPFKSIISLALSRPRDLSPPLIRPLPILHPLGHRLVIGSPFFNRRAAFLDSFPYLSFISRGTRTPEADTPPVVRSRSLSRSHSRANFPPSTERQPRSDPAFSRRQLLFSLRGRVSLVLNDGHFNRGREKAG